jgi:hypothetical protein
MQFGRALLRILQKIVCSDPRLGPVYLSKVDIADGFYYILIRVEDVAKLGVIFPTGSNEEHIVYIHLVLSMGWNQSPPLFTATTKAVTDLDNTHLSMNIPSVKHRLYNVYETPPKPEPPCQPPSPVQRLCLCINLLNNMMHVVQPLSKLSMSMWMILLVWCKGTPNTITMSNTCF